MSTICFVCWYGEATSVGYAQSFAKYLSDTYTSVPDIQIGTAGMRHPQAMLPRSPTMLHWAQRSDVMVVVASGIDITDILAYNPKGEIYFMQEHLDENNNSRKAVYSYLERLLG